MSKTFTLRYLDQNECESFPSREYETAKEARAEMKAQAKDKAWFNTRSESDRAWEDCVEIQYCVDGEVMANTFTAWVREIAV